MITNGAVIVPQYGDENDALALEQIQEIFPGERSYWRIYARDRIWRWQYSLYYDAAAEVQVRHMW